MAGNAARITSPTICRLFWLTCVQIVLRRVPGGVVHVDHVDGGDAGADEVHVVVFHREQLVDERAGMAETGGRGPDRVHQPRRRIRLAPDEQVAVADHVEQHQRLHPGQRAGLLRRLDVVAAAVGVVGAGPVPVHRLFAVEEEQLDREGRAGSRPARARVRAAPRWTTRRRWRRRSGTAPAWCRSGWPARCAPAGGRRWCR